MWITISQIVQAGKIPLCVILLGNFHVEQK